MILANVTFGSRRKDEPDQLEDIAESYLGTLPSSGQLCGDYFLDLDERSPERARAACRPSSVRAAPPLTIRQEGTREGHRRLRQNTCVADSR